MPHKVINHEEILKQILDAIINHEEIVN